MNKLLVVLTGKTASGKDTIARKLLTKYPTFQKIITTTSRGPRAGEKQGVDYNFISKEEFDRKIGAGDFIEYVNYGANLYGTEKDQISANLGKDSIWRIDPSRAGQIREFIRSAFEPALAEEVLKKVVVIYLNVPDQIVLRRLEQRWMNKGEVEQRMGEDKKFWEQYKDSYDYVVENAEGHLEETVDKIIKIIENHIS